MACEQCEYSYVRVQTFASKIPYGTCIAPSAAACYPDQPHANRDRIGTRVRIARSSERTLRRRQYQQPEEHGRILERPTSATPTAPAVAMRSSSSTGRESYGGCALGPAAPNGASELLSLDFRRCPIDELRRLCHALSKNLLRSSLPSAADLGHASRDVERFHCGIGTELGLLR
jgi:hypothetical protein